MLMFCLSVDDLDIQSDSARPRGMGREMVGDTTGRTPGLTPGRVVAVEC